MNEELSFGLGMDTSPFARAWRGTQEMVKQGAEKITDTFKEMGKGLVAPFAAFASVEGVKRVLEFAESVERGAEIAGTSAEFFQNFAASMRETGGDAEKGSKGLERLTALIGQAAEGSKEAAEAFSKHNIAITNLDGSARSTEDVMRDIADKINLTASAEERAALATDIFGKKLGLELIPALRQGAAGIDQMGAKAAHLTETELENLSNLNKAFKSSMNFAEVWAGKLISSISDVGTVLGALSTGTGGLDRLSQAMARDEAMAEKAKQIAEAAGDHQKGIDELNTILDLTYKLQAAQKDAAYKEESKTEQLSDLWEKNIGLQSEADAAGEGTAEWLQKQIDLANLGVTIAEKKKEVDKEAADAAKEADRQKQEAYADQVRLQTEIHNAEMSMQDEVEKRQEDIDSKTELTIAELAASKFRFGGTLGEDQQKAKQIQELERQREWNRLHGNVDAARDRLNRINDIKSTLSDNVQLDASEKANQKSDEAITKSQEHLQEILALAKNKGIGVVVNSGAP